MSTLSWQDHWANFDRATYAHLGGDDRLALASARVLTSIRSAYQAEESRRRFEMRYGMESQLGFLNQLPDLLADLERRVTEASCAPGLATNPSPKGGERIAGLIHDLELVSDRYWRPCGAMSPVVEALVQEGDSALEPLLRCLEEDTRLTRAVRFYRDPYAERTFPGVQEPAYTALQGIFRTNFFGPEATVDNLIEHGLTGWRAVADGNRDEAIKQRATYLETYGDNLQRGPDQPDCGNEAMAPSHEQSWFLGWPANADQVRLGFPAPDHPATAEDMREHRAIFALEGERRQWKLPQRPMRALWTTLQDEPLHGTTTDASGKTVAVSEYDQWAGAWQAEEVLKDGHWERFVGVVSAHRVARVPASDIEFYLPDEWYMVPDQWRRHDY